jgi:osmotically-inducible protein OsmY
VETATRIENRTDADIAADSGQALDLYASIPRGVQAAVRGGHVTLTGAVAWLFQKTHAENIVRRIPGVHGVCNQLAVAPDAVGRDVHHRIINATLHCNANLDARRIAVSVNGDTATLTGTVTTRLERDSAERATAGAPGIATVLNHIVVEPVQSADITSP